MDRTIAFQCGATLMLTLMPRVLFTLLLFNGLISGSYAQEITAPRCSGDERITEQFDNGAVWDLSLIHI